MKKWIISTLLKCQWFKEGVMEALGIDELNAAILRLEEANKVLAKKLADALTPKCSGDVTPKKRKYNKKTETKN